MSYFYFIKKKSIVIPHTYVWSTGNDKSTSTCWGSAFGVLTSGVYCGGRNTTTYYNTTENFDGTNWSSGGDMNMAHIFQSAGGSQTDGIVMGGYSGSTQLRQSELYNGVSWSVTGFLSVTRSSHAGAGLTSGAFVAGGGNNTCEEFVTNTWSAGGNLPYSPTYPTGTGELTAGLIVGGQNYNKSAEYDGTTWTEGNQMSSEKDGIGVAGSISSSIIAGGEDDSFGSPWCTNVAETYDGTNFTTISSMPVKYFSGSGFGSPTGFAYSAGATLGGSTSGHKKTYIYS